MAELRAFSRAASQAYKIPPPAAKPRIQHFLPYFGSRDMRFREVFQKIKKFFEINHEWAQEEHQTTNEPAVAQGHGGSLSVFFDLLFRRKSAPKLPPQKRAPSTSPSRGSATGGNEEKPNFEIGKLNLLN